MSWDFFPSGSAPEPLTVVWCRFPFDEKPAHPAPSPHPCVVKRTFEDEDGNPWLHVVYGTSQAVRATEGTFQISGSNVPALGLKKDPTTICFWRIAEVPFAKEFFPVVGGLSEPTAYAMAGNLARDFATEAAHFDHKMNPKINQSPASPKREVP